MSIKIDFTADAAYVWIAENDSGQRIAWTEHVTKSVTVDVDEHDNPIGVEVIGLKTEIPIGKLVREWDVPDETIRELLSLASAGLAGAVRVGGEAFKIEPGTLNGTAAESTPNEPAPTIGSLMAESALAKRGAESREFLMVTENVPATQHTDPATVLMDQLIAAKIEIMRLSNSVAASQPETPQQYERADDGSCKHGQTMFCTQCFTEAITPPGEPPEPAGGGLGG